MIIRRFDLEKDYERLQGLWVARELPNLPKEVLPLYGVVAEEDGYLIAAAFLATVSVGVSTIGFLASAITASKEVRGEALDNILRVLLMVSDAMGYHVMSAATNHPSLQARYEKLGFRRTDENVVHYARGI